MMGSHEGGAALMVGSGGDWGSHECSPLKSQQTRVLYLVWPSLGVLAPFRRLASAIPPHRVETGTFSARFSARLFPRGGVPFSFQLVWHAAYRYHGIMVTKVLMCFSDVPSGGEDWRTYIMAHFWNLS